MTITPQKAQQLLEGITQGEWEYVKNPMMEQGRFRHPYVREASEDPYSRKTICHIYPSGGVDEGDIIAAAPAIAREYIKASERAEQRTLEVCKLHDENRRLRDALQFYANEGSYDAFDKIRESSPGNKARETLKEQTS